MHDFYTRTLHSIQRMAERGVSEDDLRCALGRGRIKVFSSCQIARFYDPRSRTTAIVNLWARRIVTVWKV